jgi:hypothetical protein
MGWPILGKLEWSEARYVEFELAKLGTERPDLSPRNMAVVKCCFESARIKYSSNRYGRNKTIFSTISYYPSCSGCNQLSEIGSRSFNYQSHRIISSPGTHLELLCELPSEEGNARWQCTRGTRVDPAQQQFYMRDLGYAPIWTG